MFRSIRWRIALPYMILILLGLGGLTAYLSNLARQAHLADLQAQLLAEARLVAADAAPILGSQAELDARVSQWSRLLGARVTIIGADGTVLGESHADRRQMENHLHRPEVQQALAWGQGMSIRTSATEGYAMMYVAVPIGGSPPVGFARVALSLSQVDAQVARLQQAILIAAVLATVVAVLLAILIAERTARPVRWLTRVAERLAKGDLNARLTPTTRDEVGRLTRAFDDMADQLQHEITDLATERSRLSAMLEHMADGVLIVGAEGQVELINPAARHLLRVTLEQARGRSLAQVVRHHQLIELWQHTRGSGTEQTATEEIGPELFLHVIVTPLPLVGHASELVILQDLTRVRRLETVRRDFISNVSHELRTPLASLKALVDTLRDGALDDPPAAQHFLDRMEGEIDSLTQMVEELLALSRIESGQAPLNLRPAGLGDVVIPAVERLRPQAERAGIALQVELPPDLPAVRADVERLQQVITNLVHNAIKFTLPAGRVTVSASWQGGEVILSVQDTGIGIPAADLPRIFERFYKVDRARTRGSPPGCGQPGGVPGTRGLQGVPGTRGGTGLGLAIAKHVVQAHGGRIWAESVEGRGSTFYVSLPAQDSV